jgi:hypothetical protein
MFMDFREFGNTLLVKHEGVGIIFPDDSEYEVARQLYNRKHNLYPSMIIRTLNQSAIKELVHYVALNGIELAIRGGGHHIAGFGSTQGGILLDFSIYRDVVIDEVKGIAIVSPGARLGDVDHALCQRGYVIPTGTVSDTGIAGLTLGGGIGWLLGTYGFTCENLVGEDLLWALRGGGGNFGIVLEFRYLLSKLPSVYCGTIEVFNQDIEGVLNRLIVYLNNHCPSNLVVAPVLQNLGHDRGCCLSIDFCLSGSEDQVELIGFEDYLGLPQRHIFLTNDFISWQAWSDERFAQPMRGYWKSVCPDELREEIWPLLLKWIERVPGSNCSITIEHLNPLRRRGKAVEAALPIIEKNYGILFSARWLTSDEDQEHVSWVKGAVESLTSRQRYSSYSNYTFEGENNDQVERVVERDRLFRTKQKYDPSNVFRRNHNIQCGTS